MGIQQVALPARSNSIQVDPDDVAEVIAMLDDLPKGQGIAVDEPQDSAGAARVRARKMKDAVEAEAPDWAKKLRTHTIAVDPDDEDAGFYPAISVKVGEQSK